MLVVAGLSFTSPGFAYMATTLGTVGILIVTEFTVHYSYEFKNQTYPSHIVYYS